MKLQNFQINLFPALQRRRVFTPATMTATEFNRLKENGKVSIVSEQGVLIEEKIVDKHLIKIYSMTGFFVEVWVGVKKLKIHKVEALEKGNKLTSYLDNL
jgi:hypothetical protein